MREVQGAAVVNQLLDTVDHGARLGREFLDARQAGAGDRLIARHDQPGQAGLLVQRLEDRHRGHGGAVRVGDDALRSVVGVAGEVDLADDQGTSGSLRQADELSMTTAPAAANRGACTRDMVAPAENKAMSSPDGSAVSLFSTSISWPRYVSFLPSDRAEAKNRTEVAGNSRCSSRARITWPT